MIIDWNKLRNEAYEELKKDLEDEISTTERKIEHLERLKAKKKIWEDTLQFCRITDIDFDCETIKTFKESEAENLDHQIRELSKKVDVLDALLDRLLEDKRHYGNK